MPEFLHYMRILRERHVSVALRELYSRFFREPVIQSLRRIMDTCEKYGAAFTFFIVGVSADCRRDFIREIIDRGHEIACHGFYHLSFEFLSEAEIREDIEKCLEFFSDHFGYNLKGFRAPYLRYNTSVAKVLAELGFVYSSSRREEGELEKCNGKMIECPISVDDWRILIEQNRGAEGLYEEMNKNRKRHTTFLLHPWRVGQRRYIHALEKFLDENSDNISFPNMVDFVTSGRGIALSGDVGEMALAELFKRSITGK